MTVPPGFWRRCFGHDAALASIALVTGAGGVLLAADYLERRATEKSAELEGRYSTVPVVVAAADIAQGSRLQTSVLASRQMPLAFLPKDAIELEGAGALLGATARIDIQRGTPILASTVSRQVDRATLAATLSADERAVTIAVDEISSHAGGLRVGDHVDLYLSRSLSGETVLVPLLQHVEILGTGADLREAPGAQQDADAERRYATITLRVGASEAPRLLMAQQAGQLALLLRADGDASSVAMRVLRGPDLMPPAREGTGRARTGMELLVGGTGAPVPDRSWLQAGAVSRNGESS